VEAVHAFIGKGKATAGIVMPLESPFGFSVPINGLTRAKGAVSAANPEETPSNPRLQISALVFIS
jgi:hypothetical protein